MQSVTLSSFSAPGSHQLVFIVYFIVYLVLAFCSCSRVAVCLPMLFFILIWIYTSDFLCAFSTKVMTQNQNMLCLSFSKTGRNQQIDIVLLDTDSTHVPPLDITDFHHSTMLSPWLHLPDSNLEWTKQPGYCGLELILLRWMSWSP